MSARPSRTDRNRREPHRDSGNKGHAIVVGASMAGLSIAKALTGSFDRVTVLDRDGIPDDIANRKGVPQGRHLHVLLTAGGRRAGGAVPRPAGRVRRGRRGHRRPRCTWPDVCQR